jgi:hypothetical protein
LKDGEMGFFDNLRETFGGDRDGAQTGSSSEADLHAVPAMSAARHVNYDAPAEAPEDATVTTGGKHAARD